MLKILARIGGNNSEIQDYNSRLLKFENVVNRISLNDLFNAIALNTVE